MGHGPTYNILISSSRQWNPGDEFILMGVRRIIRSILKPQPNYILWNRNPDLFVDRWRQPIFRPDLLSNSATQPALDIVDLVVLAGTPEWFGPPVERIYRELLRYPEIPLLALGVGSGSPGFQFSSLEREIYLRDRTLLICRNPMLAREINEQFGFEKALLLPCPALFCASDNAPRSEESFRDTLPALGIQGDAVENQSAPSPLVRDLEQYATELSDSRAWVFVAHYIEEFHRFTRMCGKAPIFYSYDSRDYMRFYRQNQRILVTSRLHGALASLSCGSPAMLIDFGNARVSDAAVPFGSLLPSHTLEPCIHAADSLSVAEAAVWSGQIVDFKRRAFAKYRAVVKGFVDRWLPGHVEAASGDDAYETLSLIPTAA